MAKSLLKKAKKAAGPAAKKVRNKDTRAEQAKREWKHLSVPKVPSVSIRDHIEKLSGERRDCFTIWTVIKNNEKYNTNEKIKELIRAKEYETLLGEIS